MATDTFVIPRYFDPLKVVYIIIEAVFARRLS